MAPRRQRRPVPCQKLSGKTGPLETVHVSGIDPVTSETISKRVFAEGDWIHYKGHECVLVSHHRVLYLCAPGEVLLENVLVCRD